MNSDFEIADIKSSIDMDNDDIDDQTDILQGTRKYIATNLSCILETKGESKTYASI